MITSGIGEVLQETPRDRGESVPAPDRDANGDFERLRELLLGDERRALEAAHARIAELEAAQKNLPKRLPDAAVEALRGENVATRVAGALSEPVAQALGAAVQNNRQSIIDALFPVIGPLIRKSIAEALRNLVADLNGAIESSFTARGLKWRMEAWRAGVPYAQVVLKHRLAYRIEHVFLIERATGLVLRHESAPDITPLDADAIAGMLTALGDFVGDSVGQDGGLESMSVGEYLVWVVQGPRMNLACFMRGVPPAELHTLLEQRLEELHAQAGNAPNEELHRLVEASAWQESLQPTALVRDAEALRAPVQRAPSRGPLLAIVLLAFIALAAFAVSRERWHTRVDVLRARLTAHPGFVLTGMDATPWSVLTVHGLLDPDAQPLDSTLAAAHLGKVRPQLDTTGYLSTDDAVVARRAARMLAPPPGVRLAVKDAALMLDGNAPDAWIASAREHAAWIPGVARVQFAVSGDNAAAIAAKTALERLVPSLEQRFVAFGDDAQPVDGAPATVDLIARDVRDAIGLAATAKVALVLTCVGSSDESGNDAINQRVRTDRARWLAQQLAARGIEAAPADVVAESVDLRRRGAHLRVTIRDVAL